MTKLEFLRRSQGWSQAALARHLGAGFTASVVSLIECRRLKPSARQEAVLRRAFGVSCSELLADAVDLAIVQATARETIS